MPQIQKGDTFADGQQVTGARLNQLIDSATILPAIITDQTNLTANTVATGDSVLLYDLSATALREATASDLLNSNIAVTTSSITGGANSDITITPNDATIVSGATYTSGDGLTVVVTSNAHGLAVGQVVLISSAGTGYNGTFRLTAVTTNTFTYVMTTAATAGSGSLSFTRKGTVKNTANKTISGNLYVDGNAVITGTTVNTGNVSVGGALTVTGNVTGNLNIPTAPTSGNHATNKTYVDGTVSKLTNGYITLPNGLIMQWGFDSNTFNVTTTFPIAFPTACLNVQITLKTATNSVQDGKAITALVYSFSTTGFVAQAAGYNSASINGKYWFAIGY